MAPLWRPGARAAMWLLGAVAYVGVLVVGMNAVKGDSAGAGAGFWISQIAASCCGAAGKPSSVRLCDSRLTIACARVGGVGGARLARDARCSVALELRLGERRGREPRVGMRRLHCHRRHAPHARSDGDATSWCPLEPGSDRCAGGARRRSHGKRGCVSVAAACEQCDHNGLARRCRPGAGGGGRVDRTPRIWVERGSVTDDRRACRSIGGDMPYLRSLRAGASLIDVRVGPCADLNGLATFGSNRILGRLAYPCRRPRGGSPTGCAPWP